MHADHLRRGRGQQFGHRVGVGVGGIEPEVPGVVRQHHGHAVVDLCDAFVGGSETADYTPNSPGCNHKPPGQSMLVKQQLHFAPAC